MRKTLHGRDVCIHLGNGGRQKKTEEVLVKAHTLS